MELEGHKWVRVFRDLEEAREKLGDLKPRALRYRDQRVCLVRNGDKLRAFFDECPHSRVPLSRGYCTNKGEIVCYLHSYIYDLGTGSELENRTGELVFFPIKESEEGIFIGFPNPPDQST